MPKSVRFGPGKAWPVLARRRMLIFNFFEVFLKRCQSARVRKPALFLQHLCIVDKTWLSWNFLKGWRLGLCPAALLFQVAEWYFRGAFFALLQIRVKKNAGFSAFQALVFGRCYEKPPINAKFSGFFEAIVENPLSSEKGVDQLKFFIAPFDAPRRDIFKDTSQPGLPHGQGGQKQGRKFGSLLNLEK